MNTIPKFSRKQLELMRQDVAENGMSLKKKKKAQKIVGELKTEKEKK